MKLLTHVETVIYPAVSRAGSGVRMGMLCT